MTAQGAVVAAIVILVAGVTGAAPLVYVPDIIRRGNSAKPTVEVLERVASRNGRQLTLTMKPRSEDFDIDLDFEGTRLHAMRMIFKHTAEPKHLDYVMSQRAANSLNLLHMRGVRLSRSGEDCVIDFDAHALRLFGPTGRLRMRTADESKETAAVEPGAHAAEENHAADHKPATAPAKKPAQAAKAEKAAE